jgi:hypothetical protein
MTILHEGLDLTTYKDITVWAITAIFFWSCCQLGELTIPSPSAFDSKKHIPCNMDICWLQTEGSSKNGANRFASLHISWSKTTAFAGRHLHYSLDPMTHFAHLSA